MTILLMAIRVVVDVNLLTPAVRYIAGGFSAPLAEVHSGIAAYGIASLVGFALFSIATPHLGRKKFYLLSLCGFALTSVLCNMATTTGMLTIFRVLEGLAAGGLLAAAFSTLLAMFGAGRRLAVDFAFGFGCLLAGPIFGPTIGGYLTDNFTWRWIFSLNFPLGVIAGIFALLLLPKDASPSPTRPLRNWAHIAAMTLALAWWNYFFALHF
jgi:DHA2 family multidrug resistance protein